MKGYIRNCLIKARKSDSSLFDATTGIAYLDGYAIVPREDYDALAARCAELDALVSRIYRKACKEQYETTMLMSNPAQNPAAYYIKTMIEDSKLSDADGGSLAEK